MAYAAVISLKHTIERLKNSINPKIRKAAYEELNSLRSMLKKMDDSSSRSIDRSGIYELDAKIRDELWKLEDLLEPYNSLPPSQGHGCKGCLAVSLIDEIEIFSFLRTVKILREEYNKELQQKPSPGREGDGILFSTVLPIHEYIGGNKSTTVGLSDLSENIINYLLFGNLSIDLVRWTFKTVSLVGMAGIGKTHLAALVYNHPLIVQYFDVRAWVRVGPKDQINNIATQIESMPKLKEFLKENYWGNRRYLIVFDDIWSTEVLDYFTDFLFYKSLKIHLLITTRQQEVAKYYPSAKVHQMPLLNNEESWNLLWQNVFVGESTFPYQLEKPGRKIAENCEGLPLLILTVANILRGLDKTEEYWKKVAEKKTTTFTDAYDQIYEVLLSSYEYLPQHLKPCFLYMGVFPQSCVIRSSKLVNLWVVEDFLESSLLQNLEEYGTECLQDLISKSLAIACKQILERINSFKLHSAYWYVCVTEARKNKFFHVLNKLTDVSIEKQRRLAVQNNILLGIKEVYDLMAAAASTTRSLLCTGEDHQYPVRICFDMMLLKVLDALAIRFYEFPEEALKLVQLRYLALTHNGKLPSSVSKLQQLQCLITRQHHTVKFVRPKKWYIRQGSTKSVGDSTCLPKKIWALQELRHLRINGSNLPDPRYGAELPKLSTLYVNAQSCTKRVFRSIPHLEKLGIKIELQPGASAETVTCLKHIGILEGLESLKCVVVNPGLRFQLAVVPPNHLSNFPRGLKKLSLNGLGYPWKYMSAIASLVSLQVLKLQCSSFQGPHWETEPGVGQFPSLEFLLLEDIDLVHWTAKPNFRQFGRQYIIFKCFPHLRHLIVRHCYKLKMIPLEIGDILTLEKIEVDDCSPSVVDSAHQIKEKTKPHFQLVINSSWN